MSSKSTKVRWNEVYPGFPTEETIRALHGAPSRARVTADRHAAGEESNGSSIAAKVYVLFGSCTFRTPAEIELEEGDILDFAGGAYSIKADSDVGVRLVWAWDFPEWFRPHNRPASIEEQRGAPGSPGSKGWG